MRGSLSTFLQAIQIVYILEHITTVLNISNVIPYLYHTF